MTTVPGTLLISLDFELYWGVRDQRSLDQYRENLLGVRTAVPAMLELFAAHDIHATWSTVGFLFFANRSELLDGLPARRPDYRDPNLCPYGHLGSVREDEEEDPYHFAPSLIHLIESYAHQEVATHTFSHYYCLEEGQTEEAFEDDLRAAVQVAERRGLRLESLVFPRNQVNTAYLGACARHGITSFRGNAPFWLYRPRGQKSISLVVRACRFLDAYLPLSGHNAYRVSEVERSPLINLPASRFLRPYTPFLGFFEPLRLRRILANLTHAARHGLVYHLWWHPENFGVNTTQNLAFLEAILTHHATLRSSHGMESLNMRELADRLERTMG
jgi:hypothetical protein